MIFVFFLPLVLSPSVDYSLIVEAVPPEFSHLTCFPVVLESPMRRPLAVCLILVGLSPLVLLGADGGTKNSGWPQWRGPDRNGICAETGLLKEWPKDGPKLLWDSNKVNSG